MFKPLCFILIHFTLMAEVPKRIISSDKTNLFVYSNGEVDKGNEFATVWNYDSSEDLSFEHFSKNHETKKEVDKRDIFIERDSGKMQKFFEFSQRRLLGLPNSVMLSSIGFKKGIPYSWVVCRNEESCTTITSQFCEELMEIDKESSEGKVEYVNVLKKHFKELLRIKKDALHYAKEKDEKIEKILIGPYKDFFVSQYDQEAQKVLRDKNYDPFRFSSFGAKVLNECMIFNKTLPKSEKPKVKPSATHSKPSAKTK